VLRSVIAVLLLAALASACRNSRAATAPPPAAAPATASHPATPEGPPVAAVPADLPPVLARVNGEPIERWELQQALEEIETIAAHPIVASERDRIIRGVVDRLIGHHLAAQQARAQKLGASSAEVDASVAEAKREFPDQAAFEQALAGAGSSLEQFRRYARLRLDLSKFIAATVAPAARVDDQTVAAYYSTNAGDFQEPETLHASLIFVSAPADSGAAKRKEARAKADGILADLRKGGDFARMATTRSEDPGSAQNGGDLGRFERGHFEPAFDAVAFALPPGQISDVVESPIGYYIIKSHEHQPARPQPLAEVKEQIAARLAEQLQNEKFAEFVRQAKARAKIEIDF
jgi:parvulin-like peptidyl-prolyl isomerase